MRAMRAWSRKTGLRKDQAQCSVALRGRGACAQPMNLVGRTQQFIPEEDSEVRSREEHVAWSKERALEYLEQDDIQSAITSMLFNMSQHPETKQIVNPTLTSAGMQYVTNHDRTGARRFIEGFR